MSDEKPYHHGDLAASLLRAAHQELVEQGASGFSLRRVARRAGVSHAAPAHHFGGAAGLLAALAALGFRRLIGQQTARQAAASPDARSQLLAAGLGHVDFALAEPALYRLMFGDPGLDAALPELAQTRAAAARHRDDLVGDAGGNLAARAAFFAMAHGLADLMASGQLGAMMALPQDQRDRAVASLLARVMPRAGG